MFKKIISCVVLALCFSCSFGQNKNIAATRAYCDHNRTIAAQDAVTQLKPALEDYIVDEVDRVSRSFVTNAYPVPIPITNTIYQITDNVISNRTIYETTNVLVYSQYSFITNQYYSVNNTTNFVVNVVTNVNAIIEQTTNFVYTHTYTTNMYPGPFNAITSKTANIESLHVTKDLTFGSDSTASMGSIDISGDVSIDGYITDVKGITANSIGTGALSVYGNSTFNNDVNVSGNVTLNNGDINSVSNMSAKNKITIGTRVNDRTVIERGSITADSITASSINGKEYDSINMNANVYINGDTFINGDIFGSENSYMWMDDTFATFFALNVNNLSVDGTLDFYGDSFSASNIIVQSIHNDKPYSNIKNNVIDINSKLNINALMNVNDTATFNNGLSVNGGISVDAVYSSGRNFITNIYTDLDIGKNLNVSQKIKSRDAEFGYVTAQSLDIEGTITASDLIITNETRFGPVTVRSPFTVSSVGAGLDERDVSFNDVNVTFYRSPIKLIGTDDTNIDIEIQTTKIKIVTNHFDVVGADLKIDKDAGDRGGSITSHELKTTTITSSTINNSGSIYANSMIATNITANRINVNNKTLLDSDGSIALNFDGGLDDIIIDNDGIEVKGNRDIVNVSPASASSGGKILTDHIETVNNGAVNILKGTTNADELNVSGGVSIGNGVAVEGNIVTDGNVEAINGIVKCTALQTDNLITTNVLYANFLNIKVLSSETNYIGQTTIHDQHTVDSNNQPSTIGVVETDLVKADTIDANNIILDNEKSFDINKLNTASLQVTNTTKGIMYQHTYDYQTQTYTNINVVAEQGLKNGLTVDAPVFLTGTASTGSAYLKPFWVYVEGEAEPIPMIIRFKRKSTDSNSTDNGILIPTFYDATQYNVQPDGSLQHAFYYTYPYNHLIGEDYE